MTSERLLTEALPRTWLRQCLLVVLAEGRSHGYELLRQVQDMGIASADTAAVYRTLRSMECDDVVLSEWEWSQTGPPRRSYELTEAGRQELDRGLDQIAAVRRRLGALLERGQAARV